MERELAALKESLDKNAKAKETKKPKFAGDYGLSRQEREKAKKKGCRKHSSGRRPKDAKRERVEQTLDIYPEGARPRQCEFVGE